MSDMLQLVADRTQGRSQMNTNENGSVRNNGEIFCGGRRQAKAHRTSFT
jgi:hypothetical protein